MEAKILQDFLHQYSHLEAPVDIRGIIHSLGIHIREIKMEEVDGVYLRKNNKDYFFISQNLSEKQKRFTLGHELCHYLLGEHSFSFGVSFSKDFQEKRADKFSVDLLCEDEKVREAYKEYGDISVVARLFGVTEKAMRLKFKGLFI